MSAIETKTIPETQREVFQRIPYFLLRDETLRDGYEYLMRKGKALHVDLYLARHASGDDLGQYGENSFEEVVRDGGYTAIAFEARKWSERSQQIYDDMGTGKLQFEDAINVFDDFELRVALAAKGAGIPVLLADQPHPLDSDVGLAIELEYRETLEIEDDVDQYVETSARAHNMREWCALGVLGAKLKAYEDDTAKERILMVYGSAHVGLQEKLLMLGCNVDTIAHEEIGGLAARIVPRISQLALHGMEPASSEKPTRT